MRLRIESVIRRNLKRTSAFRVAGDDEFPLQMSWGAEEGLVGWYVNPSPWDHEYVVLSNHHLVFVNTESDDEIRIPWDRVRGWHTSEDKSALTGVHIEFDGTKKFIRMAGSRGPSGKFRDAMDLLMLVKTVAEANQRE